MSADPAVVQREVDALRGSSPAELDTLRLATAAKLRTYLDTLPEVADVPEAKAQIAVFTDAMQARLDAIAYLSRAAAPPVRRAPVVIDREVLTTVESASAPAALFNPTPAYTYAAPATEMLSGRTVLIVGALSLAALLILVRKS